MRRFEVHVDFHGSCATVAEGVQFGDGVIVVCNLNKESNGYTIHLGGIAGLERVYAPEEVVWLDKEPMVIITPEDSAARHGAEAALEAEAIEHLTDEVWNGDPLP